MMLNEANTNPCLERATSIGSSDMSTRESRTNANKNSGIGPCSHRPLAATRHSKQSRNIPTPMMGGTCLL